MAKATNSKTNKELITVQLILSIALGLIFAGVIVLIANKVAGDSPLRFNLMLVAQVVLLLPVLRIIWLAFTKVRGKE